MIIFISIKKLLQTFFISIAAIALYIFYQSVGLNMFFLLVIGLLALKFVPVLVLPVLLIAIGVLFTGSSSFIADLIVWGFWGLVALPFGFALLQAVDTSLQKTKGHQKKKYHKSSIRSTR